MSIRLAAKLPIQHLCEHAACQGCVKLRSGALGPAERQPETQEVWLTAAGASAGRAEPLPLVYQWRVGQRVQAQ